MIPPIALDSTDRRLLEIVLANPRVGVREFSRRLGVARGTAQARLDKLETRGVLASWAPTLDPAALGYPLSALVHIQMAQAELEETCAGLTKVREIIEAMSVAGEFDIVCRVVSRDHAHLEEVFSAIISTPGVLRARTEVILRQRIGPRMAQLLDE